MIDDHRWSSRIIDDHKWSPMISDDHGWSPSIRGDRFALSAVFRLLNLISVANSPENKTPWSFANISRSKKTPRYTISLFGVLHSGHVLSIRIPQSMLQKLVYFSVCFSSSVLCSHLCVKPFGGVALQLNHTWRGQSILRTALLQIKSGWLFLFWWGSALPSFQLITFHAFCCCK